MANEFEHSFGVLVYDVARLLREQFNARASAFDLTQAQGRALMHLKRNEGVNQTSLANLLDIQPITLLRQLDKLELKGLIERRADAKDRRMQRLHLTAAGDALIEQLTEVGQAITDAAFSGVTAEARAQIMDVLQSVKTNLQKSGV